MTVALDIVNLDVSFASDDGPVVAVNQANLRVDEGEIVGLVGESGSGKSITAMCAMGLQPPNANVAADMIRVGGQDVLAMDDVNLQNFLGAEIALVPQEPMNALNPTMRIGKQLEIVVRSHKDIDRTQAKTYAEQFLERMLIPDIDRVMRAYPFELSGGMRQRVLLAMAFSCEPKILIADEPTTALDVTVQEEVLGLIRECAESTKTAVLFITHDLGIVWNLCSRVYVMEGGRIVETGDTHSVIGQPADPYTRRLIAALPDGHARLTQLPVNEEPSL